MRQDLVERMRSGDHDAYAALVRDSLGRLYRTARLILRDPERAEDAVQESLVLAWRDIGGLRDPERFDAWLFRILVRSCNSTGRRVRRGTVTEITLERPHDERRLDPTGALAEREEVERAFGQLTQDQRTILTLVYFADLSLADTSVAVGLPVAKASSRLHHSLEDLRAAMATDDPISRVWDGQIA